MINFDRTFIGAISGIAGGLALILYLELFGLYLPKAPEIILYVGELFIPPDQITTFLGRTIAYIAHLINSAILGIVFIYFFRLTGRDWATTKGIIFGLAVWVVLNGGMVRLLNLTMEKPSITLSMIVLTSHIIFGLVTTWSALYLSNKVKL